MKEEEHTIRLQKPDLLRIKLEDYEGKEIGCLEFDLEDINLLLRYQDLCERDKKNRDWLKKELIIIDKRQDVKGKKLLSKNEEDKQKAYNKFFNDEVEIYNMFLGKDGVKKFLNGRELGWTTLNEIDDIITNEIIPLIDKKSKSIEERIMNKYGRANKEELQ